MSRNVLNTSEGIEELRKLAFDPALKVENYKVVIERYKEWFSSFFLPPLFGDEAVLYGYYYELKEIGDFLSYNESYKLANETYEALDKLNESEMLKWLVEYEELHFENSLFIYNYLDSCYDSVNNIIRGRYFSYDGQDFSELMQFCEYFHCLYFEKLEKFKVPLENGSPNRDDNDDEMDKSLSLKYQLQARGMI